MSESPKFRRVAEHDIDFGRAQLTDEAMHFIATFLRFEFALKETGFGFKEGPAQVDWSAVDKALGPTFFQTVRDSGKAETIFREPPQRQVLHNHNLGWDAVDPPENTHQLLEAIRRVRNNLVHGGKSGDDDLNDPQRNPTLIKQAQWVIEQALKKLRDVRQLFEGKY